MLRWPVKPHPIEFLQEKIVDYATRKPMKPESQASLSVPKPAQIGEETSETSKTEYENLLAYIGERVSATRRQHKWTQQELAARAGCALATVFLVEAGRRNVTIKNLAMLSTALGLNIRDLLPYEETSTAWDAQRVALAEDVRLTRAALSNLEDRLRNFDALDTPSSAP